MPGGVLFRFFDRLLTYISCLLTYNQRIDSPALPLTMTNNRLYKPYLALKDNQRISDYCS